MLNMKTRMFFAMDKRINRIMAEQGVRSLAITTAAGSGEAANNTYQSLIAEQGEVYVLSGSQDRVVDAEEGAVDRLKAMFG